MRHICPLCIHRCSCSYFILLQTSLSLARGTSMSLMVQAAGICAPRPLSAPLGPKRKKQRLVIQSLSAITDAKARLERELP